MRNVHKTRYNEEKQVIWRDLILPIPSDPKKKIDVGQIKCPLALIVGGDDQNWPAPESAVDIEKVMKDAGNSHLLTTLSYPMAGHLFEPPFAPLCRTSIFIGKDKEEAHVLWGGETEAHAHAQQHSWWKILSFLEQHLHSSGESTLLVAQLSAEPPRKATVTSVKTRL
ncbi:hypothetical protein AGOR_G00247650 [Albula goreensis]|uniref:BAAT/Acyl-CoA thioester hydrolase C-terminal domain-containing protein n=1 Tax=Albula goreensis TaxID=1534307 RepID=A0A8T3CGH0_9TELE|nr:hypothetical protein AGOR_G00247650 [Albula goreensis]